MSFLKRFVFLSLALFGTTACEGDARTPARALVCNLGALTFEQRARHLLVTRRLLGHAQRRELPGSYVLAVDRAHVSVAELAEWVADESRCCPAVDFAVELPASGPLTLRMGGGPEVKKFIAAELNL